MMGFVAALSSSMAFIVLIMSAQLLNIINVRAEREKQAESIQISAEIVDSKVNILSDTNKDGNNRYSYYISKAQISALVSTNKPVTLYCTYGNNFSLEIAKKISAYNYILLKENVKKLHIDLKNPVLNNNSTTKDSCYLTTLGSQGEG